MTTRRIAANPIPYWSRAGKTREVFEEAFKDFQDIGFTAVKADVPDDMSPSAYAGWIAGYGLSPSLSLFNSPFDETVDMAEEVERAKRFAATQVALGLDRTAVGAGFDEGRLARAIDNCGTVCRVLRAEGLRPLHHSHVGGVFETEGEIVRLLDDLGPDVIGFGPDTGHLRWAGIEPAPFIRRYADRIGGIHIKDCFPDLLAAGSRAGMSYQQVQSTKRLWAARSGRGGLRGGRGRHPRRLRRRLHDRGGRAERGVEAGVAPHLVRLGSAQPSGVNRMMTTT